MMVRQLVIAATVGAGLGAVAGSIAFLAVSYGADIYFRCSGWRTSRQARRTA